MVSCKDCIHSCVCPIADGCEYADEEHIRDDCEYFAYTADVVPKSEVIDEFAERLKKYYDSLKGQAPSTAIIVYHIDQIAKEMKEKNNGNEN